MGWLPESDTVLRLTLAALVAAVAFPSASYVAGLVRKGARRTASMKAVDTTLATFIAEVARIGLLVAAATLVLTLAGVEPTSVATVLGAATLAVGLALQQTLANVAAGVLILLFRPFQVGEFVEIAGRQGIVRAVGLFTTEVSTLQGVKVVVPNGQTFSQPITNYSRNPTRRADLDLTLEWDTDTALAVAAVTAAVATLPQVASDPPASILVSKLTDLGPILSVRAWTATASVVELAPALAVAVHHALREAGISAARPH